MKDNLTEDIKDCIFKFISWMDGFGETSFDHQSFFAGPIGKKAKKLYYENKLLGTIAVSPMIFFEAFYPTARKYFWKMQRFPISDAHYAMGFSLLAKAYDEQGFYQKAIHFVNELQKSRSPGFENYCWGYPFDWVTRNGLIPANTPYITSLPYGYEAFEYVYRIA